MKEGWEDLEIERTSSGTTCLNINLKTTTMGNLLYAIAVILVIAWAIGFFAYSAGSLIHILLVIAIIAIILRIIRGGTSAV
jgi:hypothetical protein